MMDDLDQILGVGNDSPETESTAEPQAQPRRHRKSGSFRRARNTETAGIQDIIRNKAKEYGLDPDMMLDIAYGESSFDPSNKTGSSSGLFQLQNKRGGSWEQYGKGQNPFDPESNADAGMRYTIDNINYLKKHLGRDPTPNEIKVAHQQGRAGAVALLENPDRPATEALSRFYGGDASSAITGNRGRLNMTAAEFADHIAGQYRPQRRTGQDIDESVGPILTSARGGQTTTTTTSAMTGPKPPESPTGDPRKDDLLRLAGLTKATNQGASQPSTAVPSIGGSLPDTLSRLAGVGQKPVTTPQADPDDPYAALIPKNRALGQGTGGASAVDDDPYAALIPKKPAVITPIPTTVRQPNDPLFNAIPLSPNNPPPPQPGIPLSNPQPAKNTPVQNMLGMLARSATPAAMASLGGGLLGFGLGGPPGAAAGAGLGPLALAGADAVGSAGQGIAKMLGLNAPAPPSQAIDQWLDALGVPNPDTPMSRAALGMGRGMVGAGSMAGGARALGEVVSPGVTKEVLGMLGEHAGTQIAGGATSGASGAAVKEMGGGNTAQFVAEIAGGMVPFLPKMVSGGKVGMENRLNNRAINTLNDLVKSDSLGIDSPANLQEAVDRVKKANDGGDVAIKDKEKWQGDVTMDKGRGITLLNVLGDNAKAAIGQAGRIPGPSRSMLRDFLREEDIEAPKQMISAIEKHLGSKSAKVEAKNKISKRSKEAREPWAKAERGAGIADAKDQFDNSINETDSAIITAEKDLKSSQKNVSDLKSDQAKNGIFSVAPKDIKDAEIVMNKKKDILDELNSQKKSLINRMKQAQESGITPPIGAIYSKNIEDILSLPEFQQGISKGVKRQIRDSKTDQTPLRLKDLAVKQVGDEYVLDGVPNMKSIMTAIQGVNEMLLTPAYRNELTGRLNQEGVSLNNSLKKLMSLVDEKNPDYKIARKQWADETANIRALMDGKHFFERENRPEYVRERWEEMSDSEREMYLISVGDQARFLIGEKSGNEALAIAKNANMKEKLSIISKDPEEFLQRIFDVDNKFQVKNEIMGNSLSADRIAQMRALEEKQGILDPAIGATDLAINVAKGNGLAAVKKARDMKNNLRLQNDLPLNQRIVEMVTKKNFGPGEFNYRTMAPRNLPINVLSGFGSQPSDDKK